MKLDGGGLGKLPYHLIPDDAEAEIVAVLGFGAIKYEPGGWAFVENARDRYFAAARRHLRASRKGEILDPEHGLMTLASAACCVLFLLGIELNEHPELAATMPERFKASLEKAKALRADRTAPWSWALVYPDKPFELPIATGGANSRPEALRVARTTQAGKGIRRARVILRNRGAEVFDALTNVSGEMRRPAKKSASKKKAPRRRKN